MEDNDSPLSDSETKELKFDQLNLEVYEPLEDYVFIAPSPPFKEGYYITHINDIKLGFGARYYLLKALQKIRAVYHDSDSIPLWAIEVDKLPELKHAITRRRGVMVPTPRETFKKAFNVGDRVVVSSNFPVKPSQYQQIVSESGDSYDQWEKRFVQKVKGQFGLVTGIDETHSMPFYTVQFSNPEKIDIATGQFYVEDLELNQLSTKGWLTEAYTIKTVTDDQKKKRRELNPGSYNPQGEIHEISEGSEQATVIHNVPPTHESTPT